MLFSEFLGIWLLGVATLAAPTLSLQCVLPGTCLPTSNPSIDLRIVVTSLTPIPTCPPGYEPCNGTIIPQCGKQYITEISKENGDSTPGAYPWQVFMTNQSEFAGSGVLIDENHVLTAAHKVFLNNRTPFLLNLKFGVWDPQDTTDIELRTAKKIILHPNFNWDTLENDVAIVELNEPIDLGLDPFINVICLPNTWSKFIGKRCVVSGWGQTQFTNDDDAVHPQKQVFVPVVDYDTCRASFYNILGAASTDKYLKLLGNLCAGGEAQKDACTNDGGGPLVCYDEVNGRYELAGLVLWGKGCGTSGVYGVYANVANYRLWIDEVLESSLTDNR